MDIFNANSTKIKQKALDLGFMDVGISKADFLEKESQQLKEWLEKGFHGDMQYMENHFEKRTDPGKLVEEAKSVISVLFNYFPKEQQVDDTYKISKYAYGKDYHYVVKDKLHQLLEFINDEIEPVHGRVFVDSAPVMDKAWAVKSGLGWIGKNTNILTREHGSFFFIGEIIIDLELDYNGAVINDYCGNCTKCIEACPTNALSPYQLDARKCISYLTIEKKGEIPIEFKGQWDNWIFGCDICQDVCPWNLRRIPHNEPEFEPHPDLLNLNKTDWASLSKEHFNEIFRKSAVKRAKFEGLKRNIEFLK